MHSSVIDAEGLAALLENLKGRGYRVVGPTLRDRAIVYDDIASLADLPAGWTDEQDGGHYRLLRRKDDALFGYAVGPHSWKQFLHPPEQRLWTARRASDDLRILPEPVDSTRFAFLGVRACELRAIAIQDGVLTGGDYVDPHYAARRDGAFIVAVNCSQAGGTCFCVSMNAGPKVTTGFDLALTELPGEEGPAFVVETGSDEGEQILAELPCRAATTDETEAAEAVVAGTAAAMGREMRSDDLPDLLMRNLEHPRWDEVAQRCLTCANCTQVCPTCFCTSVADTSELNGEDSARTRRWDSCFTLDYSFIHGGSVRSSARSRYRQWMTHKLATWIGQFGSLGCVGCGRCITWCPVAIDITEEVRAIRETEATEGNAHGS